MRTCQEFSELYELHAIGVLDPEDRSEIESHLREGCPVCSAGIKRAVADVSFLAAIPDQVEPPARLRRRVLAGVGVEKRRWNWVPVLALATAAASIIAVVWMYGQDQRRDTALAQARAEIGRMQSDLAGAQSALRFLNQPDTRQVTFGEGQPQPPRGRVFVNAQRGVLLMASNLPPVPPGKAYELWVIPKNGTPVPSGLFQSDAQGEAVYLRPGAVDLSSTGAVAVSVEPAAGSSAPTTTPIVVAPISGL